MAQNPVVWFEIYVNDMKRAKTFYESVLNVSLTELKTPAPDLEMWQFPSAGESGAGTSGALAKMKGAEPSGLGTIVYFRCDDCAIEAARIVPAGGKVKDPKMSIGEYGFIVIAYDTEGNMFGLHSMR